MTHLFSQQEEQRRAVAKPLADRMRPQTFDQFVGQEEIVGKGRPLRQAIEQDQLSSVILWGPPGSGKTTLAHIIASSTKSYFQPFSPITAGIPELRKLIREAEGRLLFKEQRTILFVDEIHRFNKAQQDAFLPWVEKGTVILIGATTQNPSFEIISPLLSRSLVLVLRPLNEEELDAILERAIKDMDKGLGKFRLELDSQARRRLINFANGDARVLLNALEFVVTNSPQNEKGIVRIDVATLYKALQKKALRYDRAGEEHYNVISAFIKSMRDSDPDGALYWLARMVEVGEDPRFIARRMLIFASEDVGNADPIGIVVASAVAYAVEHVGMPEAQINLAQGATYLASAPKSNASYSGLLEAIQDVKEYGNLGVPLHLRNAVTNLMRDLGYGQDYKYAHNFPEAKVEQEHLPQELKGQRYYRPKK